MVIAIYEVFTKERLDNMRFEVQGKDFSQELTNIQLKLVRTYNGDIRRTLAGKVSAFPVSFITVGFDLVFLGVRNNMNLLQQIMLSSDVVEIVTSYNGTTVKGNFSCTTNDCQEVKDKGERHLQQTISIVSDGSNITKENGSPFTVAIDDDVVLPSVYFGKVYGLNQVAYKSGAKLPSNKILVLGDEVLTSS